MDYLEIVPNIFDQTIAYYAKMFLNRAILCRFPTSDLVIIRNVFSFKKSVTFFRRFSIFFLGRPIYKIEALVSRGARLSYLILPCHRLYRRLYPSFRPYTGRPSVVPKRAFFHFSGARRPKCDLNENDGPSRE